MVYTTHGRKSYVFLLLAALFQFKLTHFFFLSSFFHSSLVTIALTDSVWMVCSGAKRPSSKGKLPESTTVERGRTATVDLNWATT